MKPVIQISLTEEEGAVLREALRQYVSDLRMEIADTDAMGMRDDLKREEAVLNMVIGKLDVGKTST